MQPFKLKNKLIKGKVMSIKIVTCFHLDYIRSQLRLKTRLGEEIIDFKSSDLDKVLTDLIKDYGKTYVISFTSRTTSSIALFATINFCHCALNKTLAQAIENKETLYLLVQKFKIYLTNVKLSKSSYHIITNKNLAKKTTTFVSSASFLVDGKIKYKESVLSDQDFSKTEGFHYAKGMQILNYINEERLSSGEMPIVALQ